MIVLVKMAHKIHVMLVVVNEVMDLVLKRPTHTSISFLLFSRFFKFCSHCFSGSFVLFFTIFIFLF